MINHTNIGISQFLAAYTATEIDAEKSSIHMVDFITNCAVHRMDD